jgi:hypothetical protein
MSQKYIKITEARRARVHNGALYVMQTNMSMGMLESGGYADRVYRMPYTGTLEDAQITNDWGISDIDRCIESGTVIRHGRLIR